MPTGHVCPDDVEWIARNEPRVIGRAARLCYEMLVNGRVRFETLHIVHADDTVERLVEAGMGEQVREIVRFAV